MNNIDTKQIAGMMGVTEEQVIQMMSMLQMMQQPEAQKMQKPDAQQMQQPEAQQMQKPEAQQMQQPEAQQMQQPEAPSVDYYADFNNGKINCVTQESQFYDEAMYVVLYKAIKNDLTRNSVKTLLEKKAKEFGGTALVKCFNSNCVAMKRKAKAEREEEEKQIRQAMAERRAAGTMTQFPNLPETCSGNKYIGEEWIADEDGIRKIEESGKNIKTIEACSYPIIIDKMYCPLDTAVNNTRLFDIVFASEDGYHTAMVEREELLNAGKAVGLSNRGVGVTSETARAFTAAMASMLKESSKRGALQVVYTLSKFGWDKDFKNFLPFTNSDFVFEREAQMPELMRALTPHGNREAWYKKYKEIRQKNYLPFKIACLASLASPLLAMLPKQDGFVLNLFGMSGYGKSTNNLINQTIWGSFGDDDGLVYDSRSTITAIETAADVLNNLPLVLEDLSSQSNRAKLDFQSTVMMLANGRGKMRANKDLTLRKKRFFKLVTLTTSEQNVTNGWTTSGSIYRVIAVHVDTRIPIDIPEAMAFFRDNYGFCGRDYIEQLKKMGQQGVVDIYTKCLKRATKLARDNGREQRQAVCIAAMLTADEIAGKYIFQDDIRLTDEEILQIMVNPNDVDQYARFYRTVVDFVIENPGKFEGITQPEDIHGELWGVYKRYDQNGGETIKTVSFIPNRLEKLMTEYSIDPKLFYNYLRENGLLIADAGTNQTKIKIQKFGDNCRVIKIKMPSLELDDTNKEDDMTEVVENPFTHQQQLITNIE